MTSSTVRSSFLATTVALSCVLSGACSGNTDPKTAHDDHDGHTHTDAATAAAPAGVFPAGLFAATAIEGAKPVVEAKASGKKGDRVVIVGRIGGSEDPFLAERAMFVVVDPSILLCGEETKDDHCATPWDFCCEPPERLRKHSITVVVNGADGKPISHSLAGQGGLKPGGRVTIEGIVDGVGPDGAAVIVAERMHADS